MIDWHITGARGLHAHHASLQLQLCASTSPALGVWVVDREQGIAHRPWDSNRGESRGLAVSALSRDQVKVR